MQFKVLLVDFDGVLRRWPQNDHALEIEFGLAPGAIRAVAFAPANIMPAICGELDDESWRSRIAETLATTIGSARAHAAVEKWSAAAGTIDREVLELVDSLRPQLCVGLLTNATSRLSRDLHALGLERSFDAVINSSEVGHAKSDARIFQHALKRMDVDAGQALYIDDSAANISAASALGIRGHVFIDTAGMRAFLHSSLAQRDEPR